ncbi:ap-1 complex subunit gamma [Anaeramoeba flamelloides]|uniref:AP-1 complex subunit gamma n=1 Tax=Anaeramoeba flamelloides TaxID=1746091 RepID=A0AAV7Z8V6_9EUKA|nr:ap-1 complex subunit gamma [Anaeramoeba flamelloides]
MSMQVRDLIKAVRGCKTAQKIREVITRESALIRNSFRKEDKINRPRNIYKLIYIHMLGFPSEFGQLECLKLIANPSYIGKRIGYLGLSILVTENQEVLFMSTNIIRNDLSSEDRYVVGLALAALGNIGSPEMLRDLAPEIEKLMESESSYLKKKATLVAIRTIRLVPESVDRFIGKVRTLIGEKNHGVVLTGLQLVLSIVKTEPETIVKFRKLVPGLVRMLKSLVNAGYSSEYDFRGTADPFLQYNILRLLRYLGEGSKKSSKLMADILTQVGTSGGISKNVEIAILYEAVSTILSIESDSKLRVTAINTLSRFLSGRHNNSKYVALNTLLKAVNTEPKSLKRHRKVIVECLKDKDISIRRRALDLVFGIMDKKNVESLTQELLDCLPKAEKEFRYDITAKICTAIEKFSPNDKWQIDTLIKVLTIGGQYIRDDVSSMMTSVIGRNPDLQYYTSKKLFNILLDDRYRNQTFLQVSSWVIGEYGDILMQKSEKDGELINTTQALDLFQILLESSRTTDETKYYILTALIKFSTRIEGYDELIKKIIKPYREHVNVELQQRACEFFLLFDYNEIRDPILDRMPIFIEKEIELEIEEEVSENINKGENNDIQKNTQIIQNQINVNQNFQTVQNTQNTGINELLMLNTETKKTQPQNKQDSLNFLQEIFSGSGSRSNNNNNNMNNNNNNNNKTGGQGLGLDLGLGLGLGLGRNNQSQRQNQMQTQRQTQQNQMQNQRQTQQNQRQINQNQNQNKNQNQSQNKSQNQNQNQQKVQNQPFVVYEKNGIKIEMNFKVGNIRGTPAVMSIIKTTNISSIPISNYLLQVAVPKTLKAQLSQPSGQTIPPNGNGLINQQLQIIKLVQQKTQLSILLRVTYVINGQKIVENKEVSNIPIFF